MAPWDDDDFQKHRARLHHGEGSSQDRYGGYMSSESSVSSASYSSGDPRGAGAYANAQRQLDTRQGILGPYSPSAGNPQVRVPSSRYPEVRSSPEGYPEPQEPYIRYPDVRDRDPYQGPRQPNYPHRGPYGPYEGPQDPFQTPQETYQRPPDPYDQYSESQSSDSTRDTRTRRNRDGRRLAYDDGGRIVHRISRQYGNEGAIYPMQVDRHNYRVY